MWAMYSSSITTNCPFECSNANERGSLSPVLHWPPFLVEADDRALLASCSFTCLTTYEIIVRTVSSPQALYRGVVQSAFIPMYGWSHNDRYGINMGEHGP